MKPEIIIPIKITFQNQIERNDFFREVLGSSYTLKTDTLMEIEDGVKVHFDPFPIFESTDIPVDLEFYVNLAYGYGITKLAEWFHSKIKNRKTKAVKIDEKDVKKSIESIEKAIKDLEEKLQKD